MYKRSISIIFSFVALLIGNTLFAQKRAVLDNYYNNEINKQTGNPFHYLWSDTAMSGFSQLGDLFQAKGAVLSTLNSKPDKKKLKNADVFILVDPDTKDETANPNFMDATTAAAIAGWVKQGGVLLLMTNNYKNAELDSIELLTNYFGMQFTYDMLHPELSEKGKPRNFNSCASINLPSHPLFVGVNKIFLKEVAPIELKAPATAILTENGKTLMAEANYGKGYVFVIGDPWLYNEYIHHLMLPDDFENLKAAKNLVALLLEKCK